MGVPDWVIGTEFVVVHLGLRDSPDGWVVEARTLDGDDVAHLIFDRGAGDAGVPVKLVTRVAVEVRTIAIGGVVVVTFNPPTWLEDGVTLDFDAAFLRYAGVPGFDPVVESAGEPVLLPHFEFPVKGAGDV